MEGVPGRERDPVGLTLISVNSNYIMQYVRYHQIIWSPRELTARGGPGDQAGKTPTPAIAEFLHLLHKLGDLFDQETYAEFCRNQWRNWWDRLPEEQVRGVKAKLFSNYYVSMIDSLHVWSLMSESGWWDLATLDSYHDAAGKTDLTLRRGTQEVRVALLGPGSRASEARYYKLMHRAGYDVDTVVVQLPMTRPKGAGGKRWFQLSDFEALRPGQVALRA